MRLWRQLSSRLVVAVWVHECQWFLWLAAFSIFEGAGCRTTKGPRSQCPCSACAGSLALSCQPQALHTAVDGEYSGCPSYDMSHPLQLGLYEYGLNAGTLCKVQNLERASLLTVSKAFVRSIEGLVLCNARLVHLSDDNYLVHGAACPLKPHCSSGRLLSETVISQFGRMQAKIFPSMERSEMPLEFPRSDLLPLFL